MSGNRGAYAGAGNRIEQTPPHYRRINDYLAAAGCFNRTAVPGIYLTKISQLTGPLRWALPTCTKSFYQLNLLLREGNGAYWLDHVRTEQQLNNLYLIPPDTPYAWRRDAGLDAFLLYFSPDLLPPGQNKELILLSEVGIDANTHQWASQMLTRFFRDQAAGTNALVRNLPEFLATLHRKIITGSLVNPTYQRHFLAYRTLLAETATPHATVRKYAFRMGLSPNHLNAICQKVAGRTAKDLAQEQRQRKAAQLLANPSYSLRQIGQLLGFADPANFTRFWRERTGDSPSNFRKAIVDFDK